MKLNALTIRRITIAVFLIFALIFFLPVNIPYKIAIPMLIITLAGIKILPWQVTLAALFSCLGDLAGAMQSFEFQMGFFAINHIFLIWWLITQIVKVPRMVNAIYGAIVLPVLVSALILVVPEVENIALRCGVGIYAMLISTMLFTALLASHPQIKGFHKTKFIPLLAAGAVLFVISDYILAWNKFVAPVPYRTLLVISTYYGGQFLIFLGASKIKLGAAAGK